MTLPTIHAPQLISALARLRDSRRWPLLLFLLGLLRSLTLLPAYPPAQSVDSALFFLYAERLGGYDAPLLDEMVYPLYPALILLSTQWLGSIYWLAGAQALMGALLPAIYYHALRPFSASLALLAAGLMLADGQSAFVFNQMMPEPVFMFLLALATMLLLRGLGPGRQPDARAQAAAGALLLLLWLARTISRYLIVPWLLIVWWRSGRLWAGLPLLVSFTLALALYAGISGLLLGRAAGLSATDYTLSRIFVDRPHWFSPENGPASQRWAASIAACGPLNPADHFELAYCVYRQEGSWGAAENLIRDVALETVLANLPEYLPGVLQQLAQALSGTTDQHLRYENSTAASQCASVEQRVALVDPDSPPIVSRVTVSLLEYTGSDYAAHTADFQQRLRRVLGAMCPPLPRSATLHSLTMPLMAGDRLSVWPGASLWYLLALLLPLFVRWLRPWLPVVLVAGSTLLLLAGPVALLLVAGDMRYTVVTNPQQSILCAVLLVSAGRLAVRWRARTTAGA